MADIIFNVTAAAAAAVTSHSWIGCCVNNLMYKCVNKTMYKTQQHYITIVHHEIHATLFHKILNIKYSNIKDHRVFREESSARDSFEACV